MPAEGSPSERPKSIDTDLPQNREIRGERQYLYEHGLKPRTEGRPLVERYFDARETVFGEFSNVKGTNPTELSTHNYIREYPDRKLVAEMYLPAFNRFMDQKDDEISLLERTDPKRSERGMRLAVLNYLLGVTIHQSGDGNGQTNRIISLSYIREHCPDQDGHYFPIKFTEAWEDKADVIRVPDEFVEGHSSGLPLDMTETDIHLYEDVGKLRQVDREVDTEGRQGLINRRDLQALKKRTQELAGPIIDQIRESGIDIPQAMLEVEYFEFTRPINKVICGYLEKKYPRWDFDVDHRRFSSVAAQKEFVLNVLLTTPDGIEALGRYIDEGPDALRAFQPTLDPEGRVTAVFAKAADALTAIEADMRRVLSTETEEVHQKRYEDHKNKKLPLD